MWALTRSCVGVVGLLGFGQFLVLCSPQQGHPFNNMLGQGARCAGVAAYARYQPASQVSPGALDVRLKTYAYGQTFGLWSFQTSIGGIPKNKWHSQIILHMQDHEIHLDILTLGFHQNVMYDSLGMSDRQIDELQMNQSRIQKRIVQPSQHGLGHKVDICSNATQCLLGLQQLIIGTPSPQISSVYCWLILRIHPLVNWSPCIERDTWPPIWLTPFDGHCTNIFMGRFRLP